MLTLSELKPGDIVYALDTSELFAWHNEFLIYLKSKELEFILLENSDISPILNMSLKDPTDFIWTIVGQSVERLLSICFKVSNDNEVIDNKPNNITFNRIANLLR